MRQAGRQEGRQGREGWREEGKDTCGQNMET